VVIFFDCDDGGRVMREQVRTSDGEKKDIEQAREEVDDVDKNDYAIGDVVMCEGAIARN
jgi:hypothetical protein